MDLETPIGKEIFAQFRNKFHHAPVKHWYDKYVLKYRLTYYFRRREVIFTSNNIFTSVSKDTQDNKGKWRKAGKCIFICNSGSLDRNTKRERSWDNLFYYHCTCQVCSKPFMGLSTLQKPICVLSLLGIIL